MNRRSVNVAVAVVFAAAWLLPAAARQAADAAAGLDPTLLATYKWRSVGPDRGGRSIAVSGVKGRPNDGYFGAVGGGLWKTTDKGTTWTPVTDGQITSASVGAVAVSESNPDVVYIGMGESCIRGNVMEGDGIYKSTDAGKTWTHLNFPDARVISKIRIDPRNPDVVFVAAFGRLSLDSQERGVYKSADGGRTWKRTLFRDAKTGAVDLSVDRNNPNVMYAALWEAFRLEYNMSSGGPGGGLFKSTDAGETWQEITRNPGLPAGLVGKIGVAVSGADSSRVYALIENENGGLFASDDAGATWKLINGSRNIRQRAFYFTHVAADPKVKDTVYLLNVALYRSIDGGKTLTTVGGSHSDHHDLWIDPDDPQHLLLGNDGGGAVTANNGTAWSAQDFPTGQFYHVVSTAHVPYHICGAQQDASTVCIPSNTNLVGGAGGGGRGGRGGGAGAPATYSPGGFEPGYVAADPTDPDVFFAGGVNGTFLEWTNRRTGQQREVTPYPLQFSGEPSGSLVERIQWTFPIMFSPVDPKIIYTGTQHVWRSTTGGQTWDRISGDLSRHDPKTMGDSGGPITHDMNGPEVYGTVFAIAPGKRDVNVIWAGSDDGLIHVTQTNGKTWANVTPKDMPEFGRVSIIDASAFDNSTAYAAVKRPLLGDMSPYIFRTHDAGKTWTKIVAGLGALDYVHTVREDPKRKGLLYAGTQHGVYYSYDDGDHWMKLSMGLPDAPVSDLVASVNDLSISTHGRGFYILDDLELLRQYSPAVSAASDVYLFAPNDAIRSGGGATIKYWAKQPLTDLKIEVLDGKGTLIQTFTSAPPAADANAGRGGGRGGRGGGAAALQASPGIHSVAWGLRYPDAVSFPGMILWGGGVTGPLAAPGQYQVRLTANGRSQTQPFTVKRHPLYKDVTDADLQAQFDFLIQVRDKLTEANNAVIQIRRIKTDADARLANVTDEALRESVGSLKQHLSSVEEEIYQVRNQSGQDPLNFPIKINNRLASLLSMAGNGDGRPVGNAPVIFKDLTAQLKKQTDRLQQVLSTDLVSLNNVLRRLNLPVVNEK